MPKPVEKMCKNCVYLEVPNDRLGRRIVRVDTNYKCSCQMPEIPAVPAWLDHFRNALIVNSERSHIRTVWGDDGKNCATYQERQK